MDLPILQLSTIISYFIFHANSLWARCSSKYVTPKIHCLYDHLDGERFDEFQKVKFLLNQDFEVFDYYDVLRTPNTFCSYTYLANFNMTSTEILI